MIAVLLLGKVIISPTLPVLLENVVVLLTHNHLFSMPKTIGVPILAHVDQFLTKLHSLLKLLVKLLPVLLLPSHHKLTTPDLNGTFKIIFCEI